MVYEKIDVANFGLSNRLKTTYITIDVSYESCLNIIMYYLINMEFLQSVYVDPHLQDHEK